MILFFFFKTLIAWLSSRGEDENFEEFDNKKLNEMLEIFYAEAKRQDGTSYSKSSLIGIRAGINRHLRNPPFKRNIVPMNSPEFATSNRMLFAVIKNMKQKGLNFTKHYPKISNADLQLVLNERAFNQNDPKQLQEKVFFDLMINFARGGRENIRSLTKSSIQFDIDDAGSRYCELKLNEKTKDHETVEDHPRMYSNDSQTCPLTSLELYMSKLNQDCEILFTKPIKTKYFKAEEKTVWFTSQPLGVNTIGELMKNISTRLNLSKIYTNHCIHATCKSLLASHGIEARQIMRVSGHKGESSLRSNDHDNSVEQQRKIADILSSSNRQQNSSTSSCTCPISSALELESSSPLLSTSRSNNLPTVSATTKLPPLAPRPLPTSILLVPVPVLVPITTSRPSNGVNSRSTSTTNSSEIELARSHENNMDSRNENVKT